MNPIEAEHKGKISLVSVVVYGVLFLGLIASLFMLNLALVAMRDFDQRKIIQQAVERGYAEWYSEKPGGRKDAWRWKEKGE